MVAAAPTRYESPAGPLQLLRYPRRRAEPLQAWCGADTLLIEAALQQPVPTGAALVVNDEHGALVNALGPAALWTDSALAARAAADNLALNGKSPVPVRWSTASPGSGLGLVVMRVPKQLGYFEYQLAVLTGAMTEGGILLCAGMDKHLSPQTATLIERYFGPVTRHRGRYKARLFSARRGAAPATAPGPPARYFCEPLDDSLIAGPNVFSGATLDIGSRFLVEQFQRLEPVADIADLACGNGVLGLCALRSGIAQRVTFCDESAMAIDSARENALALGCIDVADFHHGDGFQGLAQQFDRILCNPPFHLGHTVDDYAGRRLLSQCARQLRPGGELVLVANRHLPYQRTLGTQFKRVERLAGNKKFIVWSARLG